LTIAIYPGSFDPVTNGHLDIANRAAALFDQLIICVYDIPQKNLLFSTEEREDMIKQSVSHLANVQVERYSGLTVEYACKVNAQVMVRGLRMSSDFEREFEMALMNKKLEPKNRAGLPYDQPGASILKFQPAEGGLPAGRQH